MQHVRTKADLAMYIHSKVCKHLVSGDRVVKCATKLMSNESFIQLSFVVLLASVAYASKRRCASSYVDCDVVVSRSQTLALHRRARAWLRETSDVAVTVTIHYLATETMLLPRPSPVLRNLTA